MKIAVAANQAQISEHFSKCEGFRIYEFSGNTIHVDDYFDNDADVKGQLPDILSAKGVSVVIADGIGSGQIGKLEEKGIQIYKGISGEIAEAVFKLHKGELVSTDKPHHSCGGHSGGVCGCSGASVLPSAGGCGCK